MKTYPTSYVNGNKKAVVKFNEEWEEYRVWFYEDNKFLIAATYHTDDLADAFQTAKHWIDN